ncbi:MAG: hypothetical protein KBC12_01445 [Candidatus Pacebacteria bacterium]|nr:hypothetical protein [Candidatus Paceibacterota bacterium]MBP9851472.1 hypothetical protein [Candidatus Paceibacterota bacterium]
MSKQEKPHVIKKKIPETNDIYQSEREKNRDANKTRIFGKSELAVSNKYQEAVERLEKRNIELQKFIDEELNSEKPDLGYVEGLKGTILINQENIDHFLKIKDENMLQSFEVFAGELEDFVHTGLMQVSGGTEAYVGGVLNNLFVDESTNEELKKYFGEDLSGLTVAGLVSVLRERKLSGDFLAKATERHVAFFEKQESYLEQFAKKTKTEFVEAVTQAVKSGLLPQVAMESLPRIDHVRVVLSDRLTNLSSSTLGSVDGSGLVSVDSQNLQDKSLPQLKKVLFHEFMHELSGKSNSLVQYFDGEIRAFPKKSGLRLNSLSSLPYTHNLWINEAVTEWLALELYGSNEITKDNQEDKLAYKGSTSYVTERKGLDRLLDLGLEREIVLNAYFENFFSDSDEKPGTHFARLIKRINELEGPGSYNRMENQSIMDNVEERLQQYAFFEGAEDFPPPTGMSRLLFEVSIGHRDTTITKRTFVGFVSENGDVPVGEQLEAKKKFLQQFEEIYKGKIKITFLE